MIFSSAVPPQSVMMREQGDASSLESMLTGVAGDNLDLECVVSGGNPPARIHWYVGNRRLEGAQEIEDQESRSVTSRISFTARKEYEQEQVRCSVEHSALTSEMEAMSRLDIQCKCQN